MQQAKLARPSRVEGVSAVWSACRHSVAHRLAADAWRRGRFWNRRPPSDRRKHLSRMNCICAASWVENVPPATRGGIFNLERKAARADLTPLEPAYFTRTGSVLSAVIG